MTNLTPSDAQQVIAPEGWRLVPTEPTEEMIASGDQFMDGMSRLGDAYEAMLASAPQPQTSTYRQIDVECDCQHAKPETKQSPDQFFIVEHDSRYEVETTLHAAMQRQADFGGRIWALTGSIVKPKTDTYRQIENDGREG